MIRFRCTGCSKKLKAKDSMADKVVTCPCGQDLRVPKPQLAASDELEKKTSVQEFIRIKCTSCNRKLKVGSKNRGKLLNCPCGAKIRIGEELEKTPKIVQPAVAKSLQSAGVNASQQTAADAFPQTGLEDLSPMGLDDLPPDGFGDLPSTGLDDAPTDIPDWMATELDFPNVEFPQPVNNAYVPPAPLPATAPQTGLSSSDQLLKKAMEEEASEDEEEEDSWYVQIGSGLFCIACSIGLFMLFNNMEQTGGRMRVPWYIAITYYIGGKWVVCGVLFLGGVLASALGIATALKTPTDLLDESV